MPVNILMPALSPTMEEGTLARWHVKEGDNVTSGQIIAEIENDKATMEFEAIDEGTVGKIVVDEGTEGVKVNDLIAVLLEEGEDASTIGDADAGPPATPDKTGESSPEPRKTAAPPGDKADAKPKPDAAKTGERIFASPLARRLAAERGIDLKSMNGSGPHGRIIRADIEKAPKSEEAAPPEQAPSPPAPERAAASGGFSTEQVKRLYSDRRFEEVKLDGMRRTIAARLTEAKQTIPHFYLRREIKLDPLLAFRGTLNKELEPRGIKLSVNDFIIKASAATLQEVPDCNAVWAGDRILKLEPSDVAVAVAVDGGLFTPVLRDAHSKSLSMLSAEMKDLAARARSRKLAPHEYQGGSFAISNLGMFGVENFDAVINPPQASILAVGSGIKRPVITAEDQIEVATMLSLTLSVDHRVIDGALGARFLGVLKRNLENPLSMLA
ncbi:pyruvate dehydrogenase complex dihydrolipoamide acetyltransferase [soil metagenome]